jgi:hypothetical protein
VGIMKAAGFSSEDMHRWQCEFERAAPDSHREFLQYLRISESEISEIRSWSKKGARAESASGKNDGRTAGGHGGTVVPVREATACAR